LALILPHSVFFHFPKTGGYFVREVIRRSGIPFSVDDPENHSFHNIDPSHLADEEISSRLKFIFIRHPMEWYASYWNHRNHVGWNGDLHPGWNAVQIYQSKGADSFEGFLEQVLREGVPFISQHRELFEQMDRVGRFEDLRNELCRIFAQAGEAVGCRLIQNLPPKNVIPYPEAGAPRVARELYMRMVDLESWAFEYFGYPPVSERYDLI
jgi:hypothetical protein